MGARLTPLSSGVRNPSIVFTDNGPPILSGFKIVDDPACNDSLETQVTLWVMERLSRGVACV